MAKTRIEKLMESVKVSAADFIERERAILKLSPALNYILGGGITEGSFTLITGAHKFGKTAASLYICKQAQKALGYRVVYLNGEHRLTKRDILSTKGLDHKNADVYTSNKKDMIYAEDFVNLARTELETEEKVILIADSLSQMCPRELADKPDIGEQYRDPTPKILANLTRVLSPILSVTNNIFIAITHSHMDTSGKSFGSGRVEGGGTKIQYAHDFKLKGLYAQSWEDKIGNEIGKKMNWECGTSALGPPKRKCTGYLRYNHGIDEEMELMSLAQLAQIPSLKVAGSWLTLFDQKVQGIDNAAALLRKDKELYSSVETEVWSILGNRTSFGESEDDGAESEDVPDKE